MLNGMQYPPQTNDLPSPCIIVSKQHVTQTHPIGICTASTAYVIKKKLLALWGRKCRWSKRTIAKKKCGRISASEHCSEHGGKSM